MPGISDVKETRILVVREGRREPVSVFCNGMIVVRKDNSQHDQQASLIMIEVKQVSHLIQRPESNAC